MSTPETTNGAIYGDESLMEAMYAMRDSLSEWERVGAAEEIDLDEIEVVDGRFVQCLQRLNWVVQACGRRRSVIAD